MGGSSREKSPRSKLLPLAVPWCIDPLRAAFSMVTGEYPDDQPTELGLYAYALSEARQGPFQLQLIRVTFQQAVAARMEPFEPEDMLMFEPQPSVEEGTDGFQVGVAELQRILGQWRRTGICAESGFYEVARSRWMRELGVDEDEVRHYFTFGRRMRVDVLARGWDWHVEQTIPEAPPPYWPTG